MSLAWVSFRPQVTFGSANLRFASMALFFEAVRVRIKGQPANLRIQKTLDVADCLVFPCGYVTQQVFNRPSTYHHCIFHLVGRNSVDYPGQVVPLGYDLRQNPATL